MAPDGESYRRVVPSPLPRDIVEWRAIETLLQVDRVRGQSVAAGEFHGSDGLRGSRATSGHAWQHCGASAPR